MKIFIDTNIYLRFYDSSSKEFKKLLNSLIEIKDVIFIPQQVVDETERNKLDVFLRAFKEHIKNAKFNKISLPEQVESIENEELKSWNKETLDLQNKIREQESKLKEITSKLIIEINENKDGVSKSLLEIFNLKTIPNEEQINKAKLRKALGNPPGKKGDPIGDELSWEQILDVASGIDNLYIISADTDYLYEFNKVCYLNSKLYSELKSKNSNLRIHCFNTLSEGLKKYSEKESKISLPSNDEMELIKQAEKEQYLDEIVDKLSESEIQNIPLRTNRKCIKCKNGVLIGPVMKISRYGGYTDQYFCNNCKSVFDTGNPYE